MVLGLPMWLFQGLTVSSRALSVPFCRSLQRPPVGPQATRATRRTGSGLTDYAPTALSPHALTATPVCYRLQVTARETSCDLSTLRLQRKLELHWRRCNRGGRLASCRCPYWWIMAVTQAVVCGYINIYVGYGIGPLRFRYTNGLLLV